MDLKSLINKSTSNNQLYQPTPDWRRCIEVRLYSKKCPYKIIYGSQGTRYYDNNERTYVDANVYSNDQLSIDIKGTKKITTAENTGSVAITNLTYEEILKLIELEYYGIEIWVGYATSDLFCFFKGEVAYISNKIQSHRDNTCYILFASEFVASFSQARSGICLNSSINLYSAVEYLSETLGFTSNNLTGTSKNDILSEITNAYDKGYDILDSMISNTDYDIDTDSSKFGDVIDITNLEDKRQIVIDPTNLILGTQPTLSSTGLQLSVLPNFDYSPGDIIIIDNGLIDISETDLSSARSSLKGQYFDTTLSKSTEDKRNNGMYMIREIDYHFQNRGSTFQLNITAKAISLLENLIG